MSIAYLHDKIRKSDSINNLTWFEEVFFYRLLTICDGCGRYDARPKVLKADLFQLKDGITLKQIEKALNRLSTAGMVLVYTYDQRTFLQLVNWEKYQDARDEKSDYPPPPEYVENKSRAKPTENQPGNVKLLFPIDKPPPEVFCVMPCEGKKQEYKVTREYLSEMSGLYRGIDIERETLNALAWLKNNPTKRKTHNGMTRFLGSWYSKAQNNAPIRLPVAGQEAVPPEQVYQKPENQPEEWVNALNSIREAVGNQCFNTWFDPVACHGIRDGTLELTVPTESFRTCLIENYKPLLLKATGAKEISVRQWKAS